MKKSEDKTADKTADKEQKVSLEENFSAIEEILIKMEDAELPPRASRGCPS